MRQVCKDQEWRRYNNRKFDGLAGYTRKVLSQNEAVQNFRCQGYGASGGSLLAADH